MKNIDLRIIFTMICSIAAIFFLPYAGAWFHYDGVLPSDFFSFPNLIAPDKAPFNKYVFGFYSLFGIAFILFYFFPKIYGFKSPALKDYPKIETTKLPTWFYIGLVLWGVTLAIDWLKLSEPKWIINWGAVPLFWGFAFILDGIVYKRTGGKSIISVRPKEIFGIGVASCSGWMIFEYLNFFVRDTWIYPMGDLIPDNEFMLYAILGSSGLLPLAFEWNSLLKTFPSLRYKFSNGPKISVPGWVQSLVFIASLGSLFIAPFFPNTLFGVLWFSPMVMLGILLSKFGIWNPFTSLKNGDWSHLALIGLAYFIQGTLCEFWNYFSAYHQNGNVVNTYNPDYWTYSIPYVDVLKVFEMPALGLLGYIPFGVYCAVWWITFSFIVDIPSHYNEFEN